MGCSQFQASPITSEAVWNGAKASLNPTVQKNFLKNVFRSMKGIIYAATCCSYRPSKNSVADLIDGVLIILQKTQQLINDKFFQN